jgi:hypothetical protein
MWNNLPLIADFSDIDTAVLVGYMGNEYKTNWSIKDSILTYDSIDYRIIKLTNDSLIFSPFLELDYTPEIYRTEYDDGTIVEEEPVFDTHYVFRKISNSKLKISSLEGSEKLSNKRFERVQSIIKHHYPLEFIEFLDNGVSISSSRNDSTNILYFQDDCWMIFDYKGYKFLYFYHSWHQNNGFMNYGYQLCDLSNSGFRIKINREEDLTRYKYIEPSPSQINSDSFMGDWYSVNDTSNYYARHIPKSQIERGRMQLFSDTLFYSFYNDSLIIDNKIFTAVLCKWRISSDNNLLIYEFPVDNQWFQGYHVEYSKIDKVVNDSLFLELFQNAMQTGIEYPHTLILNRYQEFVRF